MADTYQGMSFEDFVDKEAKNYEIPDNSILGALSHVMGGHGFYTGGETLGPKTKNDMIELFKEPYETELKESSKKQKKDAL